MSKTRKWKVRFQEVGKKNIGETTHSGNLDEEGVIEFFGLNGPDIVWYELNEITK